MSQYVFEVKLRILFVGLYVILKSEIECSYPVSFLSVFLSAVRVLLVSHVTGNSLRLNLYDVGHYHREILGSLQAHHIQVNECKTEYIFHQKCENRRVRRLRVVPRVEARASRHAT